MRYGYFDHAAGEYVIDRVDANTSFTNYLGVEDMCTCLNHLAGGYSFYKSPQYHRITRFRPNGVPMDRPGHYVYLRDDDSGAYWSVSWQPVGLPLDKARYECRHGMSYSTFRCDYDGLAASQRLFIPLGDAVELWDVRVENRSDRPRRLSLYGYCEFSFHHIDMDNQNFQMSLYAAGSSYRDGVIEYDLFYEPDGFQYFTANREPDGFDALRDSFIGPYRTETNPIAVESGRCAQSFEKTGNHCGGLQHRVTLAPGESVRLVYLLGEGGHEAGVVMREKYRDVSAVDRAFDALRAYWDQKLDVLQIDTPHEGMNTFINRWNLYQAEVNILFSRFASFIEVGGRTGLGYRDTAQDAMCVAHSNPRMVRRRLCELLNGLTDKGYGLHLFQPEWFAPKPDNSEEEAFRSPTVVPSMLRSFDFDDLSDVCSDDALWLIPAICEYVRESGETGFFDERHGYANGGEGTTYEHMKRILDFTDTHVGPNGIAQGLRADWNDCLNLGGGESAMVSFLHVWAIDAFCEAARFLGRDGDAAHYAAMGDRVRAVCRETLWDGEWFIRGITKNGKRIGTREDKEGRVHLESNAWAILSGVATPEQAEKAAESVRTYLATDFGLMLNAPSYTVPNIDIGFVTRVYPGVKENGAIFSHSNPWMWAALCRIGQGDRALEYYDALLPYAQNDRMELRAAEPYSYCQFIMGRDHTAHGRARHPFMTGSAGWAYYATTHYLLGLRPGFDRWELDPALPTHWTGFSLTRRWRGALYRITVSRAEDGAETGLWLNGERAEYIPVQPAGSDNLVEVRL